MKNPSGRLLIVDDDPALRQMLAWEFEELGYSVAAAADCASARQITSQQSFDAAILDYHLTDGTGLELGRHLKTCFPEIRIVLCSGAAPLAAQRLAPASGAFTFVEKPVQVHKLNALLTNT